MAGNRLIALALGLLALCALLLLWQLRAPYGFILELRGVKLAALVMVGAATGAATIVFQTLVGNRLLTPGIVGFDALYLFLQALLVFTLGASVLASIPAGLSFLAETAVMMGAAMLLFGLFLRKGSDDLIKLVLTAVILGVLLRGLESLVLRLLDPSEFAVVQQAGVASFGAVEAVQLLPAGLALSLALAASLWLAPALDLAALGRTAARSLGLRHDRLVMQGLALVAVLVSVSTALVGPVTFLGLLAASLARALIPSARHSVLIPASALMGAAILVLGQFVFERLLGQQAALSVVIEFVGGLVFLALVLRRRTA
ncbi:iron chelate uptake ABC transporter family permease subunit [Pararhodobacter zhoushanensis]|uniref:iron chelate uptake ABC transporter family permease subunit n=1 Tax=Pararhodobacter zhoushanensis TaxID=2479545 RepID=UPI000F8CD50F|nr:iron chelate uptake ABC transporter family permease subunit [Pararhodobacter zhoushanensis]